ncbi:MAG: A/G-specific adenine glycosylase [Clostridia bacterium]|nr:A/G-specific adenine glycosylase [Clostridia bacterium]
MENTQILSEIVTPLLYWYPTVARDLPWRREPTPYHVWISEIMLQQTRVEAVKGYYERFLRAFPNVEALAAADDDALNKVWQGLGYYSRARNLKKAAEEIVTQYQKTIPGELDALRSLPGIGAYTAGAIASIAFGQPTPAVDGNVLRVVTRLLLCRDDVAKQSTKDAVTDALASVYPRIPEEASAMTQALMELGATVCVPNGTPHCEDCPLQTLCLAHQAGCEMELPQKSPKPPRTQAEKTVLLLCRENRYAIRRRPEKGLLAGLWEFPSADGFLTKEEARAWILDRGFTVVKMQTLCPAKHIFTHIEWQMRGFLCEVTGGEAGNAEEELYFASSDEITSVYSIPSAFKAYLKLIEIKE